MNTPDHPTDRGLQGRGLYGYWHTITDHDLLVCRGEMRQLCDEPELLRELDAELAHRSAFDQGRRP